MSDGFSQLFSPPLSSGISEKKNGSGGHFGGRTGRYPSHHGGTGWNWLERASPWVDVSIDGTMWNFPMGHGFQVESQSLFFWNSEIRLLVIG